MQLTRLVKEARKHGKRATNTAEYAKKAARSQTKKVKRVKVVASALAHVRPSRLPRKTTPAPADPALTPGQVWHRPQGRDRWRLSPATRTLTRLRDNAALSTIISPADAKRTVDQFLRVRPSGGRVWVDEGGNAVALVDGNVVYLGHLGVDQTPVVTEDGTLGTAVVRALMNAPDSTAREILFQLQRNGHPHLTRTDINSLLYSERENFEKDDSVVPRWRAVLQATTVRTRKATQKKRKQPAKSAGKHGVYSKLVSDAGSPLGTTSRRPATPSALQTPRQVLDLMPWQREAIEAWYANECHGIIEAVTGTGKTHVGLEAAAHTAEQGQRSTVLVPSVDLQDQWVARFETFLPRLRLARVGGKESGNPARADVTIAVVNSALKSDLSTFAQNSLLVADEVHRYGAEQFQTALRAGYQRRLGLTATLERNDDAIETILRPYFGPTALTVGFDRAIREKVVAPFRLVMAPIAMSEDEEGEYGKLSRQISNGLKVLRSAAALNNGSGPSMIEQLGRLGGAAGRLGAAARSAQSGMRYRRLLLANLDGKLDAVEELAQIIGASQGAVLFTQSKEVADEAAVRLRQWGVTASALHSDMSVGERRASLRGLEDGHLQALAAPKLLDEGIDLPTIDLGVVMTASRSRRQMVQRLGRVIRRKADGRPVDFVILYAAGTVEDPESGVHEGFFDLVGEVATNRLALELGWSANDLL